MLSEFELIAKYFDRPTRHTVLGVGDDAALLTLTSGHDLVASIDTMVEGAHFFPDVEPDSLGHKALAINLSDLAAMGATPKWAMLALTVPSTDETWLEGFARGFFALAAEHDVDLIGGDTARGPRNICVQIMGEVAQGRALRRDGARVGDDIWVSGHVGEAAAAVAHLRGEITLHGSLLAHCLARLERPAPRVALGRMLIGVANSAIDISDGLIADLGHICDRSAVGAAIEFAAIPCSAELFPLREQALVTRAILTGGDDYELCFTAVAARRSAIEALSGQAGLALTRIGSIVAGKGVVVMNQGRKPMSVKDGGFDHFR